MHKRLTVATACFATVVSTPAFAWGQNGHRIIGEIAAHRISGKTHAEIELILGNENLAQASTFADEQRSNPAVFWQNEAGPYHYVTVPEAKAYADVGPPREGDAISALERFAATVRNPSASQEDRALALRFIIHIVGDLHQPLHAGNGTDRGGNDVKVRWFEDETNLHSVWDTEMIEAQNLSYTEYAERLDAQISAADTIAWWTASPVVWVGESTEIRDIIYPPPAMDGKVVTLNYAYQFEHIETVETRLKQGGVRLAAYLDTLFQT